MSIVTILIVSTMCAAVLLTTGKSVGAQNAVIAGIDSAGTRTIVIQADEGAGLTASVIDRLSTIDGIEWAGAFSAPIDVQNSAFLGSANVPLRMVFTTNTNQLDLSSRPIRDGNDAFASADALKILGMNSAAGGLTTADGMKFGLSGTTETPDFLAFLQPLLIVPTERAGTDQPVRIVVVIAKTANLVAPVADATQSVLGVNDPTHVKISTSEQLAELRTMVQDQLGFFGRSLVLLILGLSGLLVAIVMFALVMLRRKDFGRRRALGASRGLVISLLLTQVVVLSAIGSLVGSSAALLVLASNREPLPDLEFIAAVVVLAIVTSIVSALIPALVAATRDPIKELRIP